MTMKTTMQRRKRKVSEASRRVDVSADVPRSPLIGRFSLSLSAEDQAGVQGQKRKRDVEDEGEDDDDDDDDD